MPEPTSEQLRNVEARLPKQVDYICDCGNFVTTRPEILVRCDAPGCVNLMEENEESK